MDLFGIIEIFFPFFASKSKYSLLPKRSFRPDVKLRSTLVTSIYYGDADSIDHSFLIAVCLCLSLRRCCINFIHNEEFLFDLWSFIIFESSDVLKLGNIVLHFFVFFAAHINRGKLQNDLFKINFSEIWN